ncbi:enterobactin synthase subunit EntD [Rhodobacteraceae bacterium 63075]|nr:enterobactin synthase subunit EntD [Rhodobacteraceae bacterium 63075]
MKDTPIITENPFGLTWLHWCETRIAPLEGDELRYGGDPSGAVRITLPDDLRGAVAKRRREFLHGRLCAALALRSAGFPEELPRRGRAPLWPEGAAGSISHTDTRAIAVVARGGALGVDCEDVMSAEQAAALHGTLISGSEAALRPESLPFEAYLTLAFSAKEALYKALSGRMERMPGFLDVAVTGISDARLSLSFGGAAYDARYRLEGDRCVTLVMIGA